MTISLLLIVMLIDIIIQNKILILLEFFSILLKFQPEKRTFHLKKRLNLYNIKYHILSLLSSFSLL